MSWQPALNTGSWQSKDTFIEENDKISSMLYLHASRQLTQCVRDKSLETGHFNVEQMLIWILACARLIEFAG